MRKTFFATVTAVSLLLICKSCAVDNDTNTYGWRGADRTGIYAETGLQKSWAANGPRLIWDAEGIGMGYSSTTVTNNLIYVTGSKDDKDILTAFSQDGRKRWEVEYGAISTVSTFPESRATPTVHKGKIYVISGDGKLSCVSTSGKILWQVDYFTAYECAVPRFGVSESPLAYDNKVIVTPGGPKAAMVAFNADNGSVIWETPSLDEGMQYVSPLLIEQNGKKVIITVTPTWLIGIDAENGSIIWQFDMGTVNENGRANRNYIHTPIYRDGYVFMGNGYGQVSVKIKVNTDGSEPELMWSNPDFNPHVGGKLLIGNYLYGSTHDNNSMGRYVCVDWTTGETMWITEWNNKGSMIAADGLIYILEEVGGNVALVNPNPEKLEVISSFKMNSKSDVGPFWMHPVIDKGRLFLRHSDYFAVYDIKAN